MTAFGPETFEEKVNGKNSAAASSGFRSLPTSFTYLIPMVQITPFMFLPQRSSDRKMRVVTWNLNNRASNKTAWDALFALQPDIALLSEVNFVPENLHDYSSAFERATGPKRTCRRFSTGMICKGEIGATVQLSAAQPWINTALQAFPGNLVGRMIRISDLPTIPVFSFHMPSWYIPYREFTDGDVSDVLIPNWSKMAFSELLWATLSYSIGQLGPSLICGGDFNTSERIGGPRQNEANREAIRRMERLGLSEIVRALNGGPVPTFKSKHQLDHLYVTSDLSSRVTRAEVGSLAEYSEFSDHLPLVVDFV